jgi:hypothetical protein
MLETMIYNGGNVIDGTGEKIKIANAAYHEIIGKKSGQYRETKCHTTKRNIANKIYQSVIESGAFFLDCNGQRKSTKDSIHKIKKSLKDFKKRSRNPKPKKPLPKAINSVTTANTSSGDDHSLDALFAGPTSIPNELLCAVAEAKKSVLNTNSLDSPVFNASNGGLMNDVINFDNDDGRVNKPKYIAITNFIDDPLPPDLINQQNANIRAASEASVHGIGYLNSNVLDTLLPELDNNDNDDTNMAEGFGVDDETDDIDMHHLAFLLQGPNEMDCLNIVAERGKSPDVTIPFNSDSLDIAFHDRGSVGDDTNSASDVSIDSFLRGLDDDFTLADCDGCFDGSSLFDNDMLNLSRH